MKRAVSGVPYVLALVSASAAWAAEPAQEASVKVPAGPSVPDHVQYAHALWKYVTRDSSPYTKWTSVEQPPAIAVGPPAGPGSKTYVNKEAASRLDNPPHRSIVVTEHFALDPKSQKNVLAGVTVKYRSSAGYDPRNDDWYWAYYLPGGKHVECSVVTKPFAKPGFITFEDDGRLWIFRAGCKELGDYLKNGELAAHVSLPGAGPCGMTVRTPDRDTFRDYATSRPGFVTRIKDDQLWVFRAGSKEAAEFEQAGEPARQVTRPLAGPLGLTIRSSDGETIDAYLTAKQGFVTVVEDGRLWVFRQGSKDLAAFRQDGELAKHVVQPGGGPGGMTIKAPDRETIVEYSTARDGFTTVYADGRLWVFRTGCPELAEFRKDGELAKHVIRPAAGPMGLTIKAPDAQTLAQYLKAALPADGLPEQ